MEKWPKKHLFGPFLDLIEPISQPILGVRTSNLDQNTSNYLKYHKNIVREYYPGAIIEIHWKIAQKPYFGPFLGFLVF